MYTINNAEGIVRRISDGVQVAPCQSVEDPSYQDYIAWVNAGNTPEEVCTSEDLTARITRSIQAAMAFGQQLSLDFLVENTILGITKAGMVEKVREVLDMPFRAVETGSLNEAINRLKSIPVEQQYPVFITPERILKYVNRIEDYLGRTRSTRLA